MFAEVWKFWRRETLIDKAEEEVERMLIIAKDMFKIAMSVLLDKEKSRADLYKMDQGLNAIQMDVRRKILQHLSINPAMDITASLILITIIVDIERLGDYSKNVLDLSREIDKKLEGGYFDEVRKLREELAPLFGETAAVIKEMDKNVAKEGMQKCTDIAKRCDILLDQLLDETLSAKEAILATLLLRYLKRIAAHLKNVASSVVNPFARIGYKPNEQ
jgi:phosphate transport system protein